MALDTDTFKQGLRRWASGVTIITAKSETDMHGMTASSFSSVSADPPLILFCANRQTRTNAVIKDAGKFNVHVLSSEQQDLSNRFASSKTADTRFDGIAWKLGSTGQPVIAGALATLECAVHTAQDAGSHTIYIGEVLGCEVTDGEPLVYYDGAYRGVTGG